MRDLVLFLDEAEPAGDDGRAICDADDEEGGDGRDVPPIQSRPVVRIFWIVDFKCDQKCFTFGRELLEVGFGCVDAVWPPS